jgi:hypothetical protein
MRTSVRRSPRLSTNANEKIVSVPQHLLYQRDAWRAAQNRVLDRHGALAPAGQPHQVIMMVLDDFPFQVRRDE